MKILVVEDNEDSRNLLVKQLRAYGHEAMAAANGAEALQQALAQPPDIIVSDILMPKMDGYQLCRECKQNEQLKNIPFIFYTATYTREEDEKFALSLGSAAFVAKPTEPDVLVQMLSEIVERAKSGALAPPEVAPLEPSLFLTEYTRRIVAKLEDKVTQLEAEITQRKQAEEEVEHLNRMLHAIRSINQLIIRDKEQDKLLKSACTALIEARDYASTCIWLFDESGMLVAHAEAGLSKDFLPIVERLKRGELTDCIKRTLIQSDVVITEASSLTCGDCPLVKTCSSTKVVTVRMEHGGKVYGLLRLSLSGDVSISSEEQSLLQEVTDDIAFALHDMELEEEHKRAEEQLQIAEQNFRNSLDNSPLGIRIVTAEGELLYANQAILDIYGYGSVEELKAMPSKQRYTPESYAEHQERKERRKLGKPVPSSYEISIVRKDGEVRHLIASRKEVVWGGETQFQAIYQDITEHKQAEEDLRESEEKYRTTFESANDALILIDKKGKILDVNEKINVIGGYEREDLVGKNIRSLTKMMTKKSLVIVGKNFMKRMAGINVPPYEVEMRRKGGELGVFEISAAAMKKGGKVIGELAVIRDITERKQAEERLRQSEENLRAYLESAPDGVYINDLKGTFLYGNKKAEALMGYKREELIGKSFLKLKLLPAKDLAKAGKLLALDAMGRPTGPDEFELIRKDGSRVWVEINTTPTKQAEGKVVVIGFVRDITERKQAEEALRESEQRYQDLFDSTYDMIQSVTLDGHFAFVNKAWRQTLGYTEAEISDLNLLKIIHPESLSHCQELFSKVIAGESIRNVEVTFIAKDGRLIQLEGNATPRFIGGKVIATQGFFHDITERKQAEEMMMESEEKYRQLFELGSDALFLIEVKTGKILDLNNAAIEMYGYSREEALQMKNTDFSAEPDKTHKATLESEKHIPVRYHRRKDGAIFPTDISVAYYTWYGKEVCVAAIRDITEHKRAEDEIRRTAEEWSTTFDSIADFVSICDKDFRLVRVNRAFADVAKMKPEELIGRPCYEIFHGTNEPPPNCPHKVTIEAKKPATAEFFEPYLGMHLEVATSPIFNEKGEVVASVHVARDITERKNMEEQLIVTDRLASIGELSSGIAHELNNPLTSVIGFSELLLDKDVPDDVKEDLKVINREAQRTAGIVRNLLIFARKHETEKKPVNIHSIIEKVLELRAYEQKVSNIQVNTQFAPDLPEITADGFRLQQVFLNIIINAEYFMTEAHGRGTLTITTKEVGDIIRASFADDGPGIAKENLGHLFDPFFTTKEVGKGTGLGLSICHGIISEQGGRIYAESKLGKGATFVVELPISQ